MRMTLIVANVLAIFLQEADRGRYGLELMRALDLTSGTLYPVLARMEAEGWLVSRREDADPRKEGRPKRRYYLLTDLGKAAGGAQLATVQNQVKAPRKKGIKALRPSIASAGGLA